MLHPLSHILQQWCNSESFIKFLYTRTSNAPFSRRMFFCRVEFFRSTDCWLIVHGHATTLNENPSSENVRPLSKYINNSFSHKHFINGLICIILFYVYHVARIAEFHYSKIFMKANESRDTNKGKRFFFIINFCALKDFCKIFNDLMMHPFF